MNKDRLKKLLYDLDVTIKDLNKSIELIKKYINDEELKVEFSNSLKYKYLSLFIIYEEFISMLLKEMNLYEIGMSIDKALSKLNSYNKIDENTFKFLNSARLIRNKVGHRYKQPPVENIIDFLDNNKSNIANLNNYIRSFLTN